MEDLTIGAARVREYLRDGRLLRNAWTDTDTEGRKRACLLAAFVPACGSAQSADVCPADLIWPWLAHLTPWIDDAPSEAAWPGFVERYAAVVPRLAGLPDGTSRRCEYAVRALIVREARSHTTDARSVASCDTVIALCDRVAARDEPSDAEWCDAVGAAASSQAAAAAAAKVADDAAAASWASYAAAAAKVADDAAAAAAWDAAEAAASDRMVDGILSVLESATKGGAL